MKSAFHIAFGVVVCMAAVCNAAPMAGNEVKVATKGGTDIAATLGGATVSVEITTHEVDIGKPSDPRPEKAVSSCTYSRFPCAPVDYMTISVNRRPLFVARSVYADLADLNLASLRRQKDGQFVLILNGGDASESYAAKIFFDEERVRQRIIVSNEARQTVQATTYFAPKSMEK